MNDRRSFLQQAGALAVFSPLAQSRKVVKPGDKPPSAAEITEGFAKTEPGKDLSLLLATGTQEGVQCLSELSGFSYNFVRNDGNLGYFTFGGQRAISRDRGRTLEYLPKIEFPKPTEAVKLSEPQWGGTFAYNGLVGLVKMPKGLLGMSWAQSYPIGGNHDVVNMFFRVSSDDGETWSSDVLMNRGRDKGLPFQDTLRQLKSGRLIQPVRWLLWGGNHLRKTSTCTVDGKSEDFEGHGHHPEFGSCYCYYSDDQGKTWNRSYADILAFFQNGWGNFIDVDEPSLDQLPDGRLLMIMRTMVGRLFKSYSEDEGTTWSLPEPTPMAADNAPCAVRRIPSTGDLLCVWNHLSNTEVRRGLRRSRLAAAVTRDGKAWRHFRSLEWHPCLPETSEYIQPEDKIQCTRSLDHIGELAQGWGTSSYASIGFAGDQVIISYQHTVNAKRGVKMASKHKHRILPVSWFYEKPGQTPGA